MNGKDLFRSKIDNMSREELDNLIQGNNCPDRFNLESDKRCMDEDIDCKDCWKRALEKEYAEVDE
jgi:hypothetical protein